VREGASELSSDESNSGKNRKAVAGVLTSAEVPLMPIVFIIEEA